MERGMGGDTGLGSEWHTGAMARGLFLARFVWKSGFPSPPSRIFTYGGRGRGEGKGGRGPLPLPHCPGFSPIPARPPLGGDAPVHPHPGQCPCSPPEPSY